MTDSTFSWRPCWLQTARFSSLSCSFSTHTYTGARASFTHAHLFTHNYKYALRETIHKVTQRYTNLDTYPHSNIHRRTEAPTGINKYTYTLRNAHTNTYNTHIETTTRLKNLKTHTHRNKRWCIHISSSIASIKQGPPSKEIIVSVLFLHASQQRSHVCTAAADSNSVCWFSRLTNHSNRDRVLGQVTLWSSKRWLLVSRPSSTRQSVETWTPSSRSRVLATRWVKIKTVTLTTDNVMEIAVTGDLLYLIRSL